MSAKAPLVLYSGQPGQIQSGDTVDFSFLPVGTTAGTVMAGNGTTNRKIFAAGRSSVAMPINTSENIAATILIPAGTLTIQSSIEVWTLTKCSGTNGVHTLKVYLCPSTVLSGFAFANTTASGGSFHNLAKCYVKNSFTTIESVGGGTSGLGSSANNSLATVVGLVLNSDIYAIVTLQTTVGADALQLNSFDLFVNS